MGDFFTITNKSGKASKAKDEEMKKEEEEEVKIETTTPKSAKKSDGSFPDFDDFVDDLGTWKNSLKPAWDTKQFKDLHKFLTKEYKDKKVKRLYFQQNYIK